MMFPDRLSAATIYRTQVDRAEDGAVFVEVGAWKGRSAAFMAVEILNSGKKIDFYTVDHWLGSDEAAHHSDPDVASNRLFEVFCCNIEMVKGCVKSLRGYSTLVAERFSDRSLDFIYLDAGHTYADVKVDLAAWWPKLKVNGVMAGDDWCFEQHDGDRGVARAVAEFCGAHGLEIAVEPGNPNPDWLQWLVLKGKRT